MSTQTLETIYYHDNDCIMSGCPGHTAKLTYNSVADYIIYDDGFGKCTFGMDLNTLRSFLHLLKKFGYRVEISSVISLKENNEQ